ncbi:MAG TPA: hypothetical protein DCM87_08690 [Planctomycetes bacterium]|nr:hypothetical protein [Planctomycetota bacterium]
MRLRRCTWLVILFACAQATRAFTTLPEGERCSPDAFALHCALGFFSAEAYAEELAWWADDEREGREPGTPGSIQAAERAAACFARLGLLPGGDARDGARSHFQEFENGGRRGLLPGHCLKVGDRAFEWSTDWSLLDGVAEVALKDIEVVFAGYGITAPEYEYDDYAGLDVKGKAVLVLRHEPQETKADSRWKGAAPTEHASFAHKRANAESRGAAAVLCVNGPLHHDPAADRLCTLATSAGRGAVPVLHVRAPVVAALAEGTDFDLAAVQTAIDETEKPASRPLGNARIEIAGRAGVVANARNVVAILEGADPARKSEAVVIGAHYDHIGRGEYGSGVTTGEIHNGANDNASGSVGVLALAEAFVHAGLRPPRSIVFVLFDAEEKGLLGSRHYVEHPAVPIEKTVAMLNLDMIAFSARNECLVIGADSADAWPVIVAGTGGGEFAFTPQGDGGVGLALTPQGGGGGGGSDHASFLRRKIPSLFFFAGMSPGYHTPADDASACNPAIAIEILKAACTTAFLAARRHEGLAFKEPAAGPRRTRARLGVTTEARGDGALAITQVQPGSGAEKAGLKAGDVLAAAGGAPVASIDDLMKILRSRKPGDTLKVLWRRGEQEYEADVVLGR